MLHVSLLRSLPPVGIRWTSVRAFPFGAYHCTDFSVLRSLLFCANVCDVMQMLDGGDATVSSAERLLQEAVAAELGHERSQLEVRPMHRICHFERFEGVCAVALTQWTMCTSTST